MADRVERGNHRLSNRRIGIAQTDDERLECRRVTDARERACGGDGHFAIVERRDQRRRGAAIANTSERHGRGLPCVQVLGLQLLDERRHDAGAVSDQGLDDVRPHGALAEEPGQRALSGVAAKPPQDPGQPGETVRAHPMHRVEDVLGACGRHLAPDQIGDMVSGAVPILVAVEQTGERVGDHIGRGIRGIEQSHQRYRHILVTKLAERLDDRRPQQFVGEQRNEPRRDERAPDLTERLNRGKCQKEVPLQRNLGQCLACVDRA